VGLLQVIAMAAAQAVTAFLPIGSSGHRPLISALTGWPPLDAAAMLAVVTGMVLAIAVYFWRDMVALAIGAGQIARGRRDAEARRLLFLLGAAAPVGVIGFVLSDLHVTSLSAIGWMSVVFGLLLYASDRIGMTLRRLPHMTWSSALLIGAAQILALIPGVGRCGIVVTIARVIGFERAEAARFALLLALPALISAIAIAAQDVMKVGGGTVTLEASLAGLTAFIIGLGTIAAMMAWLENRSFAPFALYRMIAGAALLIWIYFG
jgi:undecaprenyl-diphosphatase